jgi:hypothetical protein
VELDQDSKSDPALRHECGTLIDSVSDFTNLVAMVVWYDFLFQVNAISKAMQSEQCCIVEAVKRMDSCSAFLDEYLSHGFERAIVTATELVGSLDVKPVFKETRKRRRNRLFVYEGEAEAVFLVPKEKLRVEFFLTTVDKVRNVCDERFALLRRNVDTWGFLFDVTVVPCDEDLRKACGDLAFALTDGEFREISGAELFQDLKSVHAFCVTPDMPSRPLDALKYLAKFSLFDVFPNLWIALRILLALPVSVASCELSFSRLKLIKNYLRSTVGQNRLNELGLLSI